MSDNAPTPELVALLELSEKASPGPWEDVGPNEDDERCIYAENDYAVAAIIPCGFPETNAERTISNAAFVVALVNWFRSTRAATVPQGVLESDALDAARWRHARMILPVDFIEQAQELYEAFGVEGSETENLKADAAIDAAMTPQQGG